MCLFMKRMSTLSTMKGSVVSAPTTTQLEPRGNYFRIFPARSPPLNSKIKLAPVSLMHAFKSSQKVLLYELKE